MKLVAGSYERFLWGWDVKLKKQELQWKFAYPAHLGPVKCIASSGAVVATGGADDTIKVFDLNAQKDMGSLYKHEGAVTCLDFHNAHKAVDHPSHLLSGSEDGTVCIWDTDAWVHLITMKVKKGPRAAVNDLSVHPSGREFYALGMGVVMEVRNAEIGSTIHRLEHDKRVICMSQCQDNLLVTGGEDCIVRAWDTRSGKQAWSVANAHANRIKGVAILGSSSEAGDGTSELPLLVASASSDGMVKVWDTRMVRNEDGTPLVPLMEAETNARLTCLVSCSIKRSGASESVPGGQDVANKQRSSAFENVEPRDAKKKLKRRDPGGDVGEVDQSPSKRQKRKNEAANVIPTRKEGSVTSTSLPSRNTQISDAPGRKSSLKGKRSSRDKLQDRDVGTADDMSPSKKRKISSSERSILSSGKGHGGGNHNKLSKKKRRLQSFPAKT